MNSAIDQLVTDASRDFVSRLSSLNEDPYIREAVMKLAIREVAWAMLEAFGDKLTIHQFSRWRVDGLKLGVMHRSRVISGMGSSGEQVNGIAIWAEGIKAELAQRLPRQRRRSGTSSRLCSRPCSMCAAPIWSRWPPGCRVRPIAGIWDINGFRGFWQTAWCAAMTS